MLDERVRRDIDLLARRVLCSVVLAFNEGIMTSKGMVTVRYTRSKVICMLILQQLASALAPILTSICCLGGLGARLGGGGEPLAVAWQVSACLRCCRVWA